MEAYDKDIEISFDVKDENVDVDRKIIQEVNLLNTDIKDEELISEYARMVEDKDFKHTD